MVNILARNAFYAQPGNLRCLIYAPFFAVFRDIWHSKNYKNCQIRGVNNSFEGRTGFGIYRDFQGFFEDFSEFLGIFWDFLDFFLKRVRDFCRVIYPSVKLLKLDSLT